jgi:hypothetical protein
MSLAKQVDHRFSLLRALSEKIRWRMPYVDSRQMVDIVRRAVPEGNGPVFLFVNLLDAHSPYNPPAEALKLLDARPDRSFRRYDSHRKLTLDWPTFSAETRSSLVDLYDGELRWIDMNLEVLLDWIEERYGDEAIVIVTSDHGEELGEHGRVGHEYGLSQTLLHVPLFVKGPYLPAGEFDSVLTIRSLYNFVLMLANGEDPPLTTIAEADTFGIVAERYPSGHDIKLSLGEGYDRPWVTLFENGIKGIGPSQYGFELYDIGTGEFHRDVAAIDTTGASALRNRIDLYWDTYRDRRTESEMGQTSEDMLRTLRSLGYIK